MKVGYFSSLCLQTIFLSIDVKLNIPQLDSYSQVLTHHIIRADNYHNGSVELLFKGNSLNLFNLKYFFILNELFFNNILQ